MQERFAGYSSDWWTPPEWWSWVEKTLRVDRSQIFDPCPADWNGNTAASGLEIDWRSPCYVNHPGARGAAVAWWAKYIAEQERVHWRLQLVWAAFSIEQLRHLRPTPLHMPGWLVLPRKRVEWIWGGPTDDKRQRGVRCTQPTSWSVFWTTEAPATPPVESIILRTA